MKIPKNQIRHLIKQRKGDRLKHKASKGKVMIQNVANFQNHLQIGQANITQESLDTKTYDQ